MVVFDPKSFKTIYFHRNECKQSYISQNIMKNVNAYKISHFSSCTVSCRDFISPHMSLFSLMHPLLLQLSVCITYVTLGPAVHHYVTLGRKVHQWRIGPESFGRVSPTKRHENHCFHAYVAYVTLGNGCWLMHLARDQNNALLTDAFNLVPRLLPMGKTLVGAGHVTLQK